jgi:hypothetical protein
MDRALAKVSVPIDVTKAPIDCPTARTLRNLWVAMARGARYGCVSEGDTDCSAGLKDGVTYHFSSFVGRQGYFAGQIHSPAESTHAARLVHIGKALIAYVDATPSARATVKADIVSEANFLLRELPR